MSITLSVEVNNTLIYVNFLAANMQRILTNMGIEVTSEFIGKIEFKELLPCISKLLECIRQLEEVDEPSSNVDAWLSRYQDVLKVFTTAYTFGKDIHYA